MADEETLLAIIQRIDERTQKTADDVDHLMRIVALGNGKPALIVAVSDLEGRMDAVEENRKSKTAVKVAVIGGAAGILAAIGGIISQVVG